MIHYYSLQCFFCLWGARKRWIGVKDIRWCFPKDKHRWLYWNWAHACHWVHIWAEEKHGNLYGLKEYITIYFSTLLGFWAACIPYHIIEISTSSRFHIWKKLGQGQRIHEHKGKKVTQCSWKDGFIIVIHMIISASSSLSKLSESLPSLRDAMWVWSNTKHTQAEQCSMTEWHDPHQLVSVDTNQFWLWLCVCNLFGF